MNPARGMVLVKPIETAESLPDGKILLTERTRQDLTSHQMEVLTVGEYAMCEDTDCERPHYWEVAFQPRLHRCNIKVGDWVLVAHRNLSETDTDSVFICSQDAVLAVLQA